MDNESDLMWKFLQARLDHRFGKYFRRAEAQSERNTPQEKSPEDGNAYKINFSVSYLNEHLDD
jgi:hypothetical protein